MSIIKQWKCDECGELEAIDSTIDLPKGWVSVRTQTVLEHHHFCSVECARKWLKEVEGVV